ncbi:hypothetical protein CTAYLR_007407 [Chrysophaeum taylorii]|uniref:Uncharacterized protein n=1 Tax=Chrysophaeum taylorii TaxID=2483200 RepID=A0AAD7XGZ3_9STRA|nr:hypothetical protein CTAYLR_007407 [Chrysophaeum taylorii]
MDLATACYEGDASMVRHLCACGADVKNSEEGTSPLFIACQRGHVDAARVLLEYGAKVQVSALWVASSNGHVGVARLLLDNGADVHRASRSGWSLLYVAIQNGHVPVARLLLERGADVNRVSNFGLTPLLAATAKGRVEMVKLLLENGAAVNRSDSFGVTPLEKACRYGALEVVKLLLQHRRDIRDEATTNVSSILYILHMRGWLARLPWLPYADPSANTSDGRTLAQIALLYSPILAELVRHQGKGAL